MLRDAGRRGGSGVAGDGKEHKGKTNIILKERGISRESEI